MTAADASAAALVDEVEQAVKQWVVRARNILGMTQRQLPTPTIRFGLRGRMAGQAVLARRRGDANAIRINIELLLSHRREMIDVTVPHEVAHVAIHCRHGRRVRPHGPEWKALMHAFGVPADVCHDMPTTPTRKLRQFPYRCGCDELAWLTSIRHRRAQNGTVYRCRRCGDKLEFAGEA